MNFGTTPIRPADLLGRLETKLKTAASINALDVFLSLAGDDDHLAMPPADQFVVIAPVSMPVWQAVVSGAGPDNTGFNTNVRISALSRLGTDQELRDSNRMRNRALGVVGLVGRVMALQFWTAPLDDDATVSYLREPMRLTDGPRFRRRRVKTDYWSVVSTSWDMKFTALLG